MRKVICRTVDGQDEIDLIDVSLRFKNGETALLSDEHADIVLRNVNFVDAATGKNPNFTCAGCGKGTTVTALLERHKVSRDRGPHTPTLVDGKRYCEDCMAKDHSAPAAAPTPAPPTPVLEPSAGEEK